MEPYGDINKKAPKRKKYCSVGLLDDIIMALLWFLPFGGAGTTDRAKR